MTSGKEKPSGIVILSILYGLYAAFFLISGIAMLTVATYAGWRHYFIPALLAGFSFIAGFMLILIGIAVLIITWGLWNLKEWAWLIAVVFAVIGLLHFPIGTLINIFILWYLFKPEVRAVFK